MMECVCDYERPSTVTETVRTARVPHVCRECRGWIEPGERYRYTWGIWDDKPESYKECSDCMAVRDYTQAHVPCFCWTYTNTLEDARDAIEAHAWQVPGMGMEFGRLLVACRRRGQKRAQGRKKGER